MRFPGVQALQILEFVVTAPSLLKASTLTWQFSRRPGKAGEIHERNYIKLATREREKKMEVRNESIHQASGFKLWRAKKLIENQQHCGHVHQAFTRALRNGTFKNVTQVACQGLIGKFDLMLEGNLIIGR